MNIICKLFERPEVDNIAKSLGNMMISGVENTGRNAAYRDLVRHQLYKNRTLLIFQDNVTLEEHSQTKALISPSGRKIYDISLSSTDTNIDILTAFQSPNDKASFIVMLLLCFGNVGEEDREDASTFYSYLIRALNSLGERYTLESLMKIKVEDAIDIVKRSSMDEDDKEEAIAFLDDGKTYSSFRGWWKCRSMLKTSGICKGLSGDRTCLDVFSKGNVSIISGYTGEDEKTRKALLNAILYAVKACAERSATLHPMSIILKNMDFMDGEVAEALFEYNRSIDFVVYVLMADISKFIEKNGNQLLQKVKSFLIFAQESYGNAKFWSDFFGNRDVQERDFSYTRRKGFNPFGTMWNTGGVVDTPKKYHSTTMGVHKVNKPIYPPEIFQNLRSDEVMCYLRDPLIRRKSRVE